MKLKNVVRKRKQKVGNRSKISSVDKRYFPLDDSSDRISSFDVNRQSYIARKWREETWKVPSIATLANVYERDK